MSDQFYLQDSRSYVGNDMLFWAKGGNGYTTDINKAEVYTKAKAMAQHYSRISDIPWPKDYIDAKTRPAVDMQYVKREEALAGTGIVLIEPQKQRKETFSCGGCGRFLSKYQFWGLCPHCGGDNRP
jgi:hypothetical protein